MEKILNQKGALLLEILLAVLVGATIIGAVSGLVYVSQKSGQNSGAKSSAISLAEEGFEAMQSISEADWHNIYLPPTGSGDPDTDKGMAKPYYVYKSGSSWALGSVVVGNEGNISIDGIIYARKIYIENITRKKTLERPICTEAENCAPDEKVKDLSTQKIKVVVSKSGSADITLEEYLTRWKNNTFSQSNWSGGSGQADFSDSSKYDSDDGNIDTGTPGSIKLKQ
ncbi:MAG: hypothetical protein Q8N37_04840 [bacterium]|nr:hypothetical protein [bacterium]